MNKRIMKTCEKSPTKTGDAKHGFFYRIWHSRSDNQLEKEGLILYKGFVFSKKCGSQYPDSELELVPIGSRSLI